MLGFSMSAAPPLYLFGCGVDGSGGMNVGDLRGGVGWWDSLWCKLSGGGGSGGGGGGGVLMQSGVALWSRRHLGAAHKELSDLHRHAISWMQLKGLFTLRTSNTYLVVLKATVKSPPPPPEKNLTTLSLSRYHEPVTHDIADLTVSISTQKPLC